jgi:anti-sigma factor RsiW
MTHSDARRRLVAYAEGALDAEQRRALEAHTRSCVACAGWLATYRMLEKETDRPEQPHAGIAPRPHPGSGDLAAHALDPSELSIAAREEIAAHLEVCPSCHREHDLTRRALAAAQPRMAPRRDEGASTDGPRRIHRLPLRMATALLAASALLALVVPTRTPVAEPALTAGSVIRDHRVVQSRERLFASDVRVAEFAHLELSAPSGVVLGEGFSVGRGARLAIGTHTDGSRPQGRPTQATPATERSETSNPKPES